MTYLPHSRSEDILAIEAEPVTANLIAQALAQEGYRCILALTGTEGLARLEEQTFSLVVIDKVLPDCDGYQICQSIKKRDPLLPVMMTGAHSTIDDEVKGLNLGADDYIATPFHPIELLARVKAILRSRSTQLFLAQYSQQLQVIGEIGRRITSILDLDCLLSEVIRLTQQAFALKCAGVGLLEGSGVLWRLGLQDEHGGIHERVVSIKLDHGRLPALIKRSRSIEIMPEVMKTAYCLIAESSFAVNSRIIVPIHQSGDILGALLACHESSEYFDDKDRLMMGMLARQLAVAVVNARLVLAQQRETQIAQTLVQSGHLINQLQNMSEIMPALVGTIAQPAGVAHSAIGFWEKAQGESILQSLYADSRDLDEALRNLIAKDGANFLNILTNTQEPSVIQLRPGQARIEKTCAEPGAPDLLITPIRRGEQIRGALFILGNSAHHFDTYDCSLAIGIAHQLASKAETLDLLSSLQRDSGQREAILMSVQNGIFLVDGSGQIVYCNPQLSDMIGTNAKTLLGHSYCVLFQQLVARSGNREKTRQDLDIAVGQITTFPIVNLTIPRPDFLHLQLHFFTVNDESGQSIGWGAALSNVTAQLERLDRMSDLLASVAHKLRTPLATIKGFATMLSGERPYWGEDGHEGYVRSIDESADQLGRLIENVLEMARMDTGVALLRRRSVAVPSLVERAVRAIRLLDKEHEFEVSIMAGLPELEIDPLRIEQVLRNLLENAVDASPAGSHVVVRVERQSDEVLISIADQRIDIPKDTLAHIFDRVPQATEVSRGQTKSAELGLYVSRAVVTAHGGRIWATSEPGHGTTIHFTLPVESFPNGSSAAPPRPNTNQLGRRLEADSHTPSNVTTILIVDDDVLQLRLFKVNLEMEGYKVMTASQGRAALEMAALQAFHLILLDLGLPDLDGFHVCARLREFSSVPIIIITGKDTEQDKLRGLGVGADDYLIKPFSPKELVARVRAVLRRAQAPGVPEGRTMLRVGDMTLDLAHREVYLRGKIVSLTLHEYKLLIYMATNPGRVLSHRQLLTEVWGPEYGDDRQYLWVSISRLRRKLEDDPGQPRYIITDPTVGYHFSEC